MAIASPEPSRVHAAPADLADGIPPPHDLDAEAAVVSAAIIDERRVSEIEWLRPSDFYSEAYRRLFEAVLDLRAAGEVVDTTTVAGRLRSTGRLAQVGGAAGIVETLNASPAIANVAAHAKIVREHSNRRRLIGMLRRQIVELTTVSVDSTSARAAIAATAASDESPSAAIAVTQVEDIFAPLPPVEWRLEGLRLAAGAPTIFAGPTYVAKTMFLQDIEVAKASGTRALGLWHTTRGKVVHVDGEQGRRITFERFQRLARARGLTAEDLRGYLEVASFPSVALDAPGAYDAYCRLLDGASIAVLDSLRALTPGVDENSSEARAPLDLLSAVSDKTGCAICVIDHTRKLTVNDSGSNLGDRVRGSNAKGQALQSLFLFSGEKKGPKRIDHEKERVYGWEVEPFGFRVEDIAKGNDPRWGLRLVHLDLEQLESSTQTVDAKVERDVETIRDFFVKSAGSFLGTKDALRGRVGIGQTRFYAALSKIGDKLVTERDQRAGTRLRWSEVPR